MFKIKNYIFTPVDAFILMKKIFTKLTLGHWIGLFVLLVSAYIMKSQTDWTNESIFFLTYIIAQPIWRIDSRVSITLALACLVTIPLLITLYNQNFLYMGEIWSETVAVWAYYFLVIGVVKQIFELRGGDKEKK